MSTKKGAEIYADIEQLFHDRKRDFIVSKQKQYWQKLECPLVEVVQKGEALSLTKSVQEQINQPIHVAAEPSRFDDMA